MKCDTCTKRPDAVSFTVHEKDMARLERSNRRLFISLLFSFLVIAGCIVLIFFLNSARVDALNAKIDAINELRELESSIETTYEYDYEIDQSADNSGSNIIVGGNFYGETENQSKNTENDTP